MLPENYTTLPGWCTIEKANKLIELVSSCKPTLTVELGVFGGRSLLALALASKKENPNSKVIGVDAWEAIASLEGTNDKANDDWWATINYTEIHKIAKQIMIDNNVDSIVELWKGKSADVLYKFEFESIDILHQDSNHSEEVSCKEVELYHSKVKKGGYWIFDDANWRTTQKAQLNLLEKGYSEIYSHNNEWKIYQKRSDSST
jgi:predicted O-methyltransferase YrrM